MSEDVLTIAAVTAVLKNLLENAVSGLSSLLNGDAAVSALPPDQIKTREEEKPRVNIFLYQVACNQGWRNEDLPSHDSKGMRLSNPPLALDLYYLLTVYGKQDFDDEILLGYAMQTFHEKPVLNRELIRSVLPSEDTGDSGDSDSQKEILKKLSASGIAEQIELIKISPYQLNTEEISKLWSAFQANYRLSTAYRVSVVLIRSRDRTRSALPVLKRNIDALPDSVPAYPALQEVKPPDNQHAVRMGEILTLSGHHLDGDKVLLRFKNVPFSVSSSITLEMPVLSGTTSTSLQVRIPDDPAGNTVDEQSPMHPDNWKAGIYSIAGIIQKSGNKELRTNELPVSIAPEVKSISVTGEEITVTCSPKVWKGQRVTLIIGDREVFAEESKEEKTGTLIFKASSLPRGEQKVRLRVDGVESIFINRKGSEPSFYEDSNHKVNIP